MGATDGRALATSSGYSPCWAVPVLPLSQMRRDHHGRQPGPAGGSVRSDQHGQLLDQQHIPATLDGYQQLVS